MKVDTLLEARYDSGYLTLEVWDDNGQTLLRIRKQDFARLREISMLDGVDLHDESDEIYEILQNAEEIHADAVWDWNNWDLRVLKR